MFNHSDTNKISVNDYHDLVVYKFYQWHYHNNEVYSSPTDYLWDHAYYHKFFTFEIL